MKKQRNSNKLKSENKRTTIMTRYINVKDLQNMSSNDIQDYLPEPPPEGSISRTVYDDRVKQFDSLIKKHNK